MRPLALFLLLCMGHIALAGFSSSSVKHLEPVLGAALNFKSESEETRQRREESFQPFPSSLNLNFEAFGTTFDFDLEIHRELTETGKIIFSGGDDDPVEERPLHHKVYRGVRKNELGEEVGWINLVAHEDGLFHSIMMVGGEIYVVDPLWMHENELDSVVKRDLEVQSEMVVYKTSDMELGGKLCGAVSSKTRTVRNETSNKDIDFGEESTTTLHPEGRIGRNLQTVARWTNCFPSNTVTRRFDVAFYADRGFYAGVGGTQKKAEEAILGLLSSSNIVYYTQVNVYLYPGTMIVKTAANGDTFNQARGACTTIDTTLTNFRKWRATQANNNDGTYHLLTDCYPPPGTVGLAYVGVLCDKNYGAGVSTLSSSTWLTVAHEIGHNFGANHAFQLGQGKTGGIMDYGDGKLNGEYQFHTTYNKAEVCNEITASMAMTGTAKVTNCWKTYAPKCGNGVIEAGEDCDDNSTCCANCKFTAGSVCSTGACCSKCQYLPSTSNCGIQGFCSNGTCVQSPCAQYSNLVFCNMSTTNPCVQTCLYNGKCTPLTSFRGINAYAPDGTICKTAPTIGRCKAGTCVTLAAAEWSAGPWSQCLLPCGAENRNRTVQCMSASGTALPDSQCETEKPNTDTQCTGASCDTVSFVWAKVQGACSATECNAVGTAQNSIQCQVQGGTAVDDSYCHTYNPSAAKPAASEECLGSCVVEATYSWIPSDTEWTDCNAKCGENGTRIPVYQCVDKNTGEVVSNSLCTTPIPENIAITCVGSCSSTASSKTIGIAVGAAVGGVVLLAAIAGALTFYVMKKKQPAKKSPSSDPISPEASFPSPPPPKPNRY